MSAETPDQIEFGPFRLDRRERRLLRDGRRVPLAGKPFDLLVVLAERSGQLVRKDELMDAVWPDTHVGEENLNRSVYEIRKALGDGKGYVETVSGHGFRLSQGRAAGDALVVERHTRTHAVTVEEVGAEDEHAERVLAPTPLPLAADAGWRRRARRALPLALALLSLSGVVALAVLSRPWASGVSARGGVERDKTALAFAPPRTIAVLPFKTIGAAGGDEEYLGLGMADALITRLGQSRRLVVRPTSAVRGYTDPRQDPVAAGRQQGVEAVLDGSVQRSGDRVRLTVQLVSVADGRPLWSGQFDEPFTDIFAVQDSISRRVMGDLLVELNAEERARLGRHGTESAEAYQEYLKGRYFWNKRTAEGFRKAVEHFNLAVERDPAYAQAHAGLADAIVFRGGDTLAERDECWARGRAALERAIELDDSLAEPHATLGLLAMNIPDNDRHFEEAGREFARAIELNPNYATAHHWHGEFLGYMGRFDEAVAEVRRAQELDPLSLIIGADLGGVYYNARRYDEAVEQLRRTLDMDPNYAVAHRWLGLAYSAQGRHAEAVAEFQKVENLADDPVELSMAAYVYGMAGRKDEARKALARLGELSQRTYVWPSCYVRAYIGLGEKDEAFRWLEKCFEEYDSGVLALKVSPILDSLRSDPRYATHLRRARFTE